MKIKINDTVVLVHQRSKAEGPVTRVQKDTNGDALAVWLPGWEQSFWLNPEAANVQEWGRPVWEAISVVPPHVVRGVVVMAETEGGDRRRVFGTDGVTIDTEVYPWVDEHGNLLKSDELRNIEAEPAPDYAAAVDAYARHEQQLGVFLDEWRKIVKQAPEATATLAHIISDVEKALGR